MASRRNPPNRKRPELIKVMTTAAEKRELLRAANKTATPLATLVRTLALAAVRRGEVVVADAVRTA